MSNNITRLVVVATVALATAVGAGIAVGAQADEESPNRAVDVAGRSAADEPTKESGGKPVVEHEAGLVLEGVGEVRGATFSVTIYENSRYGSSIQVVLGDPDDDLIGYVEQAGPFVVDGVLDASVTIQGRTVRLRGSVEPSGQPQRTVDSLQDAGQRIVTKGTHTALATDVTLSYRGAESAVGFDPAFAFDLQTRKIALYGN